MSVRWMKWAAVAAEMSMGAALAEFPPLAGLSRDAGI